MLRVIVSLILLLILPSYSYSFPCSCEISGMQDEMADMPAGERIARWANEFVGAPYDPDPLGEYVTKNVIVSDDRVDCMYLTFRSVELALGKNPVETLRIALDKRFIGMGIMEDGKVANYDNRFQYGEDMLRSGKWGEDVTASLAETSEVEGARGIKSVRIILKGDIEKASSGLKSGDIVYFVKDPKKRVVGEIVGHMGIIDRADGNAYLIHASGSKNKGGEVKKLPLMDYVNSMPFIGIIVGRFN